MLVRPYYFLLLGSALLASFSATALADEAVGNTVEPATIEGYPAWPHTQNNQQQTVVPSPPAGPYMSTGLSEGSRDFLGGSSRLAKRRSTQKTNTPFNTSMPWPMQRVAPKRWMPENGYHYAPAMPGPPPIRKLPNRKPTPVVRQQAHRYPQNVVPDRYAPPSQRGRRQAGAYGPGYRGPVPGPYPPQSRGYQSRPVPPPGSFRGPFSGLYGPR